jgi:GTP pyrophosphokinase
VEILTQKESRPNRDWLKFVKTSDARSKIKKWLREKEGVIFEKEAPEITKEKQIKSPGKAKEKDISSAQVEIDGQSRISVHFARCCQPQAGEKIQGYITVSRGVSVHRVDCHNLSKIKNADKFVEVKWKR